MTATPAMTSNDPRDLDGKRLQLAMQTLGRDPALRARMIALLRECEGQIACAGSVRDEVVGPIIDALHLDTDQYDKVLADGTRFQFLYRTKIARDFLLSEAEHPTHVWEPQTTKLLLELGRDLQGDVLVGGAYFGDQAVLVARQLAGRMDDVQDTDLIDLFLDLDSRGRRRVIQALEIAADSDVKPLLSAMQSEPMRRKITLALPRQLRFFGLSA